MSGVQDLIAVYRDLAARCDYPLHLGLTEAGMGTQGHRRLDRGAWRCCCRKASATRSASRSRPSRAATARSEVIVAQEILQTMGLRSFTPMVIACPGCGRTTSTYFQELAQKIQIDIRAADAGVAQALSRASRT